MGPLASPLRRIGRGVLPAVLILGSALVLCRLEAAAAASLSSTFAYDASEPLRLMEKSAAPSGAAVVHDITFFSQGAPVSAYLVEPSGQGPFPAILWVHWLGDTDAQSNRSEFLSEATALASQGVVSLLITEIWTPTWWKARDPALDYADSVRKVIILRRSLDILGARPRVDPARIAYVGHDFGAMYGVLLAAADRRVKASVLIAFTTHFASWLPKEPADVAAEMSGLDPVLQIGAVSPIPSFLQFAGRDEYVPASEAARLASEAGASSRSTVYPSQIHAMTAAAVAADRDAFLAERLGFGRR
jgi:dienelactone hydrolase